MRYIWTSKNKNWPRWIQNGKEWQICSTPKSALLTSATLLGWARPWCTTPKKKMEAKESLKRKPGSGGSNKIITDEFLMNLGTMIEANPSRSMRKFAKDLNVDESTIRKAVGRLGLHSYVRQKHQLLTMSAKNSRVDRGRRRGRGRPTCGPRLHQICLPLTMASGAMLKARPAWPLTKVWTTWRPPSSRSGQPCLRTMSVRSAGPLGPASRPCWLPMEAILKFNIVSQF